MLHFNQTGSPILKVYYMRTKKGYPQGWCQLEKDSFFNKHPCMLAFEKSIQGYCMSQILYGIHEEAHMGVDNPVQRRAL